MKPKARSCSSFIASFPPNAPRHCKSCLFSRLRIC
jgi:hypothetical protein